MVEYVNNGEQTFLDMNGDPLSGGFVYMYAPGTSNFSNTWVDPNASAFNTNPVVLDQAGRARIWGIGNYRQVVTDQFGNVQWDRITVAGIDFSNIPGPVGINGNLTVNGSADISGGLITNGLHNIGGFTNDGPVNVNGDLHVTGVLTGNLPLVIPRVHYDSAQTVSAADVNKVIVMSVDSFYQVSIGPPSNYSINTFFIFANTSNVRGKLVNPNGQPNFILWPRQSILILNIDNVWVYQTSRWAPPGNVTFFVDNVNGNDASDGLDSSGSGPGCFKTVQHAYDKVLSVIDPQQPLGVIIQLPNTGSSPIQEVVSLAGQAMTSAFNVNIVGNPSNPDLCQWFSAGGGSLPLIDIADYTVISFNGISFGITTGGVPALIECRQLCVADFRNCNVANDPSGVAFKVIDNARMNIIGPIGIEGSYSAFIQILNDGSISCSTCEFHLLTTTNVGLFVSIIGTGSVYLHDITFTGLVSGMGGSRYDLNGPCCVITEGSVTWPPALTPGTVANGGVEI
jgi:hypothetical protein